MIKRKERMLPEINTTALPDIIFMLLFFFMVATVVRKKEANPTIELPSTTYSDIKKSNDDKLAIGIQTVNGKTEFTLQSRVIPNTSLLQEAIQNWKKKYPEYYGVKVQLRIDKEIKMSEVNHIKQLLQKEELYNIQYVVNKKT